MLVRMVAGRAFLWRLCAFIDVAAYEALPFDGLLALPDSAVLDTLAHLVETQLCGGFQS